MNQETMRQGDQALRHAQERPGNPDSNLSLPQAVVLVAAQVLLDRLVDNGRDRLRVVGSWVANSESAIGLWVVQGLGKKRTRILVPVQNVAQARCSRPTPSVKQSTSSTRASPPALCSR